MHSQRLAEILAGFPQARVLVLGDFFLDEYLVVDPSLQEVSIETGLAAHQVVGIRSSPGAAGTVASNLAALGVGDIQALGLIGEDGRGFELLRGLRARGIGVSRMIRCDDRLTPTYTKPMRRSAGGDETEMSRLDVKNRKPTPPHREQAILRGLEEALPAVQAVVVLDQVQEDDCGVITGRVRDRLSELALAHPSKFFLADSRTRIGRFRNLIVKPNAEEAARALGDPGGPQEEQPRRLFERTQCPVFVTRGPAGIQVFDGRTLRLLAAPPCTGPIDPVGAGDSATAGIVAALCAGASLFEAAELGNLVAAVTIRKLGTTGTATPDEIRALQADFQS